jgi:hypothetical protein
MDLRDLADPRVVLLALLVVLNAGLLGAVSTSSAAYGPYNGEWDGTSSVRSIAETEASTTIAHRTTTYETARPNGSVAFVIAPQQRYSATDVARVRRFVARGGTLVVASADNRTNRLLAALGVDARLDGRLVRDDQEHYRNASLPVATPVAGAPLTEDVEQLTLNYGTVVRNESLESDDEEDAPPRVLVNTSSYSYLDTNRNGQLDDAERLASRPVVVSESVGAGSVVLVSDASVFTNAMVDRTGNRRFVEGNAAQHRHVVLDYSHGHPLPPLVYGLLVVRSSPAAQFAIGIVAVAAVLVWRRRPSLPAVGSDREDPTALSAETRSLDAEEIVTFLSSEHPDWEADRVERVAKAIIRSRAHGEDDD